jgi:ACT domain-containing protein
MIKKLVQWLYVNLAGVLGVLQAVVKALKEILTVIVNILFPIIPSAKFKTIVLLVRGIVNKVDDVIQKVKDFFLKTIA